MVKILLCEFTDRDYEIGALMITELHTLYPPDRAASVYGAMLDESICAVGTKIMHRTNPKIVALFDGKEFYSQRRKAWVKWSTAEVDQRLVRIGKVNIVTFWDFENKGGRIKERLQLDKAAVHFLREIDKEIYDLKMTIVMAAAQIHAQGKYTN